MIHIYINENEEQPRSFAGRIVKEYYDRKAIKQLRRYFLCMCVVLEQYASLAMLNVFRKILILKYIISLITNYESKALQNKILL